MMASIIAAVVGLLAIIGSIFGVYRTGKKVQQGEQSAANARAAKQAQEIRDATAGRSDSDLDGELHKWVRPDGQ